jgi:hypothetical protein
MVAPLHCINHGQLIKDDSRPRIGVYRGRVIINPDILRVLEDCRTIKGATCNAKHDERSKERLKNNKNLMNGQSFLKEVTHSVIILKTKLSFYH